MFLQKIHPIFYLPLFILLLTAVAPGEDADPMRSRYFIAEFPREKKEAAGYFLELAEKARWEVNRHGVPPLEKPVRLVYLATEKEFLRASGLEPEHFLACASPRRRVIFINGEMLRPLKPEDIFGVLIHEYSHVYIGQTVEGPIPRWLDEGLAMHLAGEWSLGDSLKLSTARLLDKTLPFSRLEAGFPGEPSAMHLAYLQSYSMTDFLMNRFFGGGGLSSFLRRLSNPREGSRILSQIQDPFILKSLEEQWKKSLGGWWRNTVVILTSGSLLWFTLATLFLFAYAKKKKQEKEKLKAWEQENFD